eukprot:SAG31_NODE_1370_length_8610_cov_2.897192_7_plen_89_part_00
MDGWAYFSIVTMSYLASCAMASSLYMPVSFAACNAMGIFSVGQYGVGTFGFGIGGVSCAVVVGASSRSERQPTVMTFQINPAGRLHLG